MNDRDFMNEFKKEAEKRIEEMEAPDYEFPEGLSKIEIAVAIGLIVISGFFMIVGRWL